jgi:chromosome segregation ATPase
MPLKLSGLTNKLPSLWSSGNTGFVDSSPQRPRISRTESKVSVNSLSSDVTLARKDSGSSCGSVNSLSDSDDPTSNSAAELKEQLEDLKAKLSRTKLALDIERREREVDKDLIDSVISRVGTDDLSDEHFKSAISSLKNRMGIKGNDIKGSDGDSCKSCERLLMDLATARTNEAMARQELDELSDRLHQMGSDKSIRKSPSKWGIWA